MHIVQWLVKATSNHVLLKHLMKAGLICLLLQTTCGLLLTISIKTRFLPTTYACTPKIQDYPNKATGQQAYITGHGDQWAVWTFMGILHLLFLSPFFMNGPMLCHAS